MAPHATDAAIKDWSSSHGASLRNVIDDRELDLHSSLDDDDLVEPVAVVGFSFKFPQDADSTDSFWKLLMEQRSTATEFPQDRLSVSAFYHPDPSRKSTVSKACDTLLYNVAYMMRSYLLTADISSRTTLLHSMLHSSRFQTLRQLLWTLNNGVFWRQLTGLWRTVS